MSFVLDAKDYVPYDALPSSFVVAHRERLLDGADNMLCVHVAAALSILYSSRHNLCIKTPLKPMQF